MLALRLTRRPDHRSLSQRLLLALAAAGATLLLLVTGQLHQEPPHPQLARLTMLGCAAPLITVLWLTVALARRGVVAARAGDRQERRTPTGLSATVPALLGSVGALALFWYVAGTTGRTAGAEQGRPWAVGELSLPPDAFALTLTVPLITVLTHLLAYRLARRARWPRAHGQDGPLVRLRETGLGWTTDAAAAARPALLGWATAATSTGVGLLTVTDRTAPLGPAASAGVVAWAGWALVAAGLVMAGPVLTHFAGRLLTLSAPGPVRLLAGRMLTADSVRAGYLAGVLAVLAGMTSAAGRLYGPSTFSPYPLLGVTVAVLGGAGVLALGTLRRNSRRLCAECRTEGAARCDHFGWAGTRTALRVVGAPRSTLRQVAALRGAALLLVLAPTSALFAMLTAYPLTH